MDDVSKGPASKGQQPAQSGVDAQSETDRDIGRGLAGAEAKPFANSPRANVEKTLPSDKPAPSSADDDESLIADRRNAGRD